MIDASKPKESPEPNDLYSIVTEEERKDWKSSLKGTQEGKVYIIPSIQLDLINMKEDEEITTWLLNLVTKEANSKIDFASGYLNPSKSIFDSLTNSSCKTSILTASPQANGFYWAGLIKKYIPKFYWHIEYKLLKNSSLNEIFEYKWEGWTFHAKGIWIYDKIDEGQNPFITVIGSSNYSNRSYWRDSECNLFIYSECEGFNEWMKMEADYLFH